MKMNEMETNFNLYADDKRVHFYSADPVWIGRFKKLAEANPEDCRIERTDGVGCFGTFPKNYFRIKPPRNISEAQKAALDALNARRHRVDDAGMNSECV